MVYPGGAWPTGGGLMVRDLLHGQEGRTPMSGCRIALVAEDAGLAAVLLTHLQRSLGPNVPLCTFAGVRDHLVHDGEGLLLLTAASPRDHDPILRLIKAMLILHLLPVLVLIEADALPLGPDPAKFDRHVSHRLRWPRDADHLTRLARERSRRVSPLTANQPATVESILSQRLLTHTPSLLPMVERIALAAAHDVTVLLTGETGTGKTSLARLLHDCSPRQGAPFLTVPCGALPANLVESAFFGHERGAFTGADRAKAGKFEAAGNGTILLDEIDTLPLEQQA